MYKTDKNPCVRGETVARRTLFYILSFTWGLPLTLAGFACMLISLLLGGSVSLSGGYVAVRIGGGWGGFSLGIFVFLCRDADDSVLYHEKGHGIQNCIYGPFMIFLVSLPSAVRYWYRRLHRGRSFKRAYGDVWFERQATDFGKRLRADQNDKTSV